MMPVQGRLRGHRHRLAGWLAGSVIYRDRWPAGWCTSPITSPCRHCWSSPSRRSPNDRLSAIGNRCRLVGISSIGALPDLTPTRPISTMHAAKTPSVRQPQRNRYVLRPIADYRHDGPAAWIDPVVLRAITISWNNIVIPVRSCRDHGHPDERPLPRFPNDFVLRIRCCTKRAQVTQDQGRSQGYDHYLHGLASLPRTA
jgi:hypothetical protein